MDHALSMGERPLSGGTLIRVRDLGRISYADAYQVQVDEHARVLASRGETDASRPGDGGASEGGYPSAGPHVGTILLVEHDPVITVSNRPGVADHLVASRDLLAKMGVDVQQTDRGGDVTYHGPGQLVIYPIVDLNRLRLRLHEYMRLMEAAVIDTCTAFGLPTHREPGATGVWTDATPEAIADARSRDIALPATPAKLCAMGVRVRRWITMHGLAINVRTNLAHFDLIVPCGLHGRQVTSLHTLLGAQSPSMDDVKTRLVDDLLRHLDAAANIAR